MKISEVKKRYKNEYAEVEYYIHTNNYRRYYDWGSDNIREIDEPAEDVKVVDYILMDEDDYNALILNNTSMYFSDIHSKNDKILCIMIKEK